MKIADDTFLGNSECEWVMYHSIQISQERLSINGSCRQVICMHIDNLNFDFDFGLSLFCRIEAKS